MRRAFLIGAVAALLAAPTVLAFFSGGYFDAPRLIATLAIWALVVVAAIVGTQPLPGAWPGRIALGGLALLTAWTGLSITWAPLSQPATASFVRMLMYLGVLIAATALLRDRGLRRVVEPALAGGALIVIGYGLAGRFLPAIVEQTASATADGRLEQPITYWNAEGALAAFGLVLCARLAGDGSRPAPMRAAAVAAAVPLGLGVYLSFSRGAIAAAIVGLIVLLAAAPTHAQLRAGLLAAGGAAVAAVLSAVLPENAVMLVALLAVMATVAWLHVLNGGSGDRIPWAAAVPKVALGAIALGLVVLVAAGLTERDDENLSQRRGAERLASVQSQRYEYWSVGIDAFADHPLNGTGAGGFRVEWQRERPEPDTALEVHSLPLEMGVELGIVGLLGFGLFAGGIAAAAAAALRRKDALAPGAAAGVTVFALHAAIDWDWQLPAVTLPALILAGALAATATRTDSAPAAAPPPRPSEPGRSPA